MVKIKNPLRRKQTQDRKKVAAEEAAIDLGKKKREMVVQAIRQALNSVEQEIVDRNEYINERDKLIYDVDFIISELDIKAGFDATNHNYLPRATEIHSNQVMGRFFSPIVRYDKEDDSLFAEGSQEAEAIKLSNENKAAMAGNAKRFIMDILERNVWKEVFGTMADTASLGGTGLIKKFYDTEDKMPRFSQIESVQHFRTLWADDNFRQRDGDAYIDMISVDSANRLYSKGLKAGDTFSKQETDNLRDDLKDQTDLPMVTRIEFVGLIYGINDNEPFYAMIIGDALVKYETRKEYFPKFYLFPNKIKLRRPWGLSDISDQAISVQKSYIERMSDYVTLINKILFPMIKAKGFEDTNLPKKEPREVQVFPMSLDQDMEALQFSPLTYPYDRILSENKESLFRILGLGRVLIDDPTVSFESSQALVTGMKSTIDIAEKKQARWQRTIVELLEDCLDDWKFFNKDVREAVGDEYSIDIEWPSVLRKEDAGFNSMLFNDVSRGFMSIETYLEKKDVRDPQEEIERIKSNMEDPILGAIVSGNARMYSQMELGQHPELAQPPQQPTNAPLTTGQNQGTAPASAPGSGAPAVSPEGAAATQQQNLGV